MADSERGELKLKHNVFLSWSGPRSRELARLLKSWLPAFVPSAVPFFSPDDIEKGTFWQSELATSISAMSAGIVCLTPENLEAPWLLFEAGALSRTFGKGRVYTYLYDLSPSQVRLPLAMINHTEANEEDTAKLIASVSSHTQGDRGADQGLDLRFKALWGNMEAELKKIPPELAAAVPRRRSSEDMLAELLELSREGSNSQLRLDSAVSHILRLLDGDMRSATLSQVKESHAFSVKSLLAEIRSARLASVRGFPPPPSTMKRFDHQRRMLRPFLSPFEENEIRESLVEIYAIISGILEPPGTSLPAQEGSVNEAPAANEHEKGTET